MPDNNNGSHISDIERLEGLEMLESEAAEDAAMVRPRQMTQSEDMPETLYRLRMLHSSETFYGYYALSGSEWPHFRTEPELEALLEGPFAAELEDAPKPGSHP